MNRLASGKLPATDTALLRLRLLGRMEATNLTGDSVLPIGGKTRGLLAILALGDRKPVTRARLAELLWSRRPDDLARASLRQEIHRLLDALSPLGVDVIDVQRHALALKPALTSVDAERVLTMTARTLDLTPQAGDVLLGELNGLDPMFDEWLSEQRARILRHVRAVIEGILRESADPAAIADAAERLLGLDELNEVAWRARLDAAQRREEHGEAIRIADLCIDAFQAHLGAQPGPETMAAIQAVRNGRSIAGAPGQTSAGSAERAEGSAPWNPARSATPAIRPGTLQATALFVAPVSLQGSGADVAGYDALSEDLSDTLDIALSQFGMVSVVSQSDPLLSDPRHGVAPGTDYVLNAILRPPARRGTVIAPPHGGGPSAYAAVDESAADPGGAPAAAGDRVAAARLVLRLLDLRDGATGHGGAGTGAIAWAMRVDLPADIAAREAFIEQLAIEIGWSLMLIEARRALPRPSADLAPSALALRAVLLLLRRDPLLFDDCAQMLELAVQRDAQQPMIWVGLTFLRLFSGFEGDASAFEGACDAAQALASHLPDSMLASILLGLALTMSPGRQAQGGAVLARYVERAGTVSGGLIGPRLAEPALMLQRVIAGEHAAAAVLFDRFQASRVGHSADAIADPLGLLVAVLCDRLEEALSLGRVLVSQYPRQTLPLIATLAALGGTGNVKKGDSEVAALRAQLERLHRGMDAARAVRGLVFLPEADRARLVTYLQRAGLA
ncbi:AfsR/SARP family transcriptional regulator [Tanticharoenia sakaeratensis]|uniref:Bacterial transcriptional activator domain-containing protein n=1 Tax=Tanticharoenia sakaeratensis NBRC 103193 TaxID=1231623 RepID=A0A0D6MIT7_9PROT|nr:helix-turn-helix domain-containing protein [Tanticharoenia sakaeratensis]GAN53574.1 hypothetical protein Tasa_010_121 [Tanticharoenia sakaeratensis NBRC 103193]GBQ17513.1 hypothetical protein AA103193_0366 [Tanticharoenia sakaeratensis NBRC 103193]